jgi:hypothetical protein
MNRLVLVALAAVGIVSAHPQTLQAQSDQAPPAACSLVPKEEVKKHLPWNAVLDGMPIEEEPIGASGSSCSYPTVFIQVLPFSQRMIDAMREKGGLEGIGDVGDEAYFRNNRDQYAELFIRVGKYLLTLQADVDGNMASVKPGAMSLAKALVEKLR